MTADKERLRILRMVQDRQISTDEAAELLDALEQPASPRERDGRLDPSTTASEVEGRQTTASTNMLVKTLELGARLARRANIDVRW
jgi:hypothetical protein